MVRQSSNPAFTCQLDVSELRRLAWRGRKFGCLWVARGSIFLACRRSFRRDLRVLRCPRVPSTAIQLGRTPLHLTEELLNARAQKLRVCHTFITQLQSFARICKEVYSKRIDCPCFFSAADHASLQGTDPERGGPIPAFSLGRSPALAGTASSQSYYQVASRTVLFRSRASKY